MSITKVFVKVRMTCGTYTATAGKGRKAKRASCTMGPTEAARSCAAKWFGLDASNTVKPVDLVVTTCDDGYLLVTMPAKGGAA